MRQVTGGGDSALPATIVLVVAVLASLVWFFWMFGVWP